MSVETDLPGDRELPETELETRYAAQPIAHGAGVTAVFDDRELELDDDSIYHAIRALWYAAVGDRDQEPGQIRRLEPADYKWLPEPRDGRDWALLLRSSRWKAGKGEGDDFTRYYKYHVFLREIDDDGELHKSPFALNFLIEPQETDLVYPDGNPVHLPYGPGTRIKIESTWAETSDALEQRMIETISELVDVDGQELEETRVDDSRRITKAEAHARVHIAQKAQIVETVDQSKSLVDYGGGADMDVSQNRKREGMFEAKVDADRWDLLGFRDVDYSTELKMYHTGGWHRFSESHPAHHPKLEASYSGSDGRNPHVSEWDDVLQRLRAIVSAHLDWADVDRADLVGDDNFGGPDAPEYTYRHPVGRREQLRQRYETVSTSIWDAATNNQTEAVYDILRTITEHNGATYDQLEERVGLSRSSIRRHCRQLQAAGVVDRIGNPVIVVFPSPQVLENAQEILRKVYPGDGIDDMNERAQERRERREERDDPAPDVGASDDDSTTSSDDESGSSSSWRYLADVELDGRRLATALDKQYLGERDVRIRVDEIPWATG